MAAHQENPQSSERAIPGASHRQAPLDGMEKVAAKFAHLGEEKRRREAEARARAEIADLWEE